MRYKIGLVAIAAMVVTVLAWGQTFDPNNKSPNITLSPGNVIATENAGYIIPINRTYAWRPGVTYNGGIPLRTNIVATLSPRGGGLDDSQQINAALGTCPAGGVVKLNPGVFNITSVGGGSPIDMSRISDCTLRGSGPGTSQTSPGDAYDASPLACGRWGGTWGSCTNPFNPLGTGTWLYRSDYGTYGVTADAPIIWMGGTAGVSNPGGILLTVDAPRLATSLTLASTAGLAVNQLVYLDQITDSNPDVWWNGGQPVGDGSRCWDQLGHCQCPDASYVCGRSISQVVKITAINGNVLTIADPLSYGFTVAANAMVSVFVSNAAHGTGLEELGMFGGGTNIAISICDSCWVRHVDMAWSQGGDGFSFTASYKSEIRDSYIHEQSQPVPGGAGYLTGVHAGAFGNLLENNIMWAGNKVDVMRASGGGNVFGYNYTDDSFGAGYPDSPEAGLNAGHYTTPHFELLEGNYSPNWKTDTFWGNSIYITIFRNQFSGLRAAFGGLATYTFMSQGGQCIGLRYYFDGYRVAVDMNGSPGVASPHNFVGNVLGFQGQTLLSINKPTCDVITQTTWIYDNLSTFLPSDGSAVAMWTIGNVDSGGVNSWDPTLYQTQLRQGNWDWYTQSAHWYANPIGGSGNSTIAPTSLPNSLYLTSKPSFFGSNPWPWVDPSTGAIHTLPAKARFQAGTPNACTNYDSTNGVCLD